MAAGGRPAAAGGDGLLYGDSPYWAVRSAAPLTGCKSHGLTRGRTRFQPRQRDCRRSGLSRRPRNSQVEPTNGTDPRCTRAATRENIAFGSPIPTILLQGFDIIGASLNHKTDMERSRSATGLRSHGSRTWLRGRSSNSIGADSPGIARLYACWLK